MSDQTKLNEIHRSLKRLFSLPIGRSTFREMQNIIFKNMEGNIENSNALLEALMTGEVKSEKIKSWPSSELKKLIDEFSISAWVAKDILDKGEFLSLITSDLINVPGQTVFSNRIRRVDGQEFHFVSDVESTLQLMHHFVGRVQELDRQKALGSHQKELEALKKALEGIGKK